MKNLPDKTLHFLTWWVFKAPKNLYTVTRRGTLLLNNDLGLTLNIKLLFTPIFGDYTLAGRVIGFIFRVMEVLSGGIVIMALEIINLLLPIVWYIFPIFLYLLHPFSFLFYLTVIPLVWYLIYHDRPLKKVTYATETDLLVSFRPRSSELLELAAGNRKDALKQILETPDIQYVLRKAELLNEEFIRSFSQTPASPKDFTAKKAFEYAREEKSRYVEPEHVFLALLSGKEKVDQFLSKYSTNLETVKQTVFWILDEREELSKTFFWQEDYKLPLMGGVGKGMTGRVTPLLDSVSVDFTREAKKRRLRKIVGRQEEIKKIGEILNGSKSNVLILGEAGSGKTSLIRDLSYNIADGVEYENLKFKRLVGLDIGALIAGTKNTGDLSLKIKMVMEEIEKSGDIILFIDEIHTLVQGAGNMGENAEGIFSLFEPYISNDRIQFIGATTIAEYRKFIEPNGAFSRLFQRVEISPASKDETLEILKAIYRVFERRYNILITYPSLKKAVELSDKLIHERVLPDKAIDIINRTASSVTRTTKILTAESVAKEISEMTHIPVSTVTQNESVKLLHIAEEMKKRVIGQNEALDMIGASLKRARVGIRNENKPIASFLFVGTTGVGKTETAKTLAETYFGDEKTMIRLDMSEYQQVDSLNKLLGTPDGKFPGVLTEAIRSKPFSLILLDEIEKAYASILLTFLQVLDDGRLTNSSGKVIDFTNSIIIATSNVGTRAIQEIAEREGTFEEMKEVALKEVQDKFAPELLNRFDGIIVFRPLDPEAVNKITELSLNKIIRMSGEKGIKVTFKPELISELIRRGYNPEWGARPLNRVIQNTVETYLADKILSREINAGDELEIGAEVFK